LSLVRNNWRRSRIRQLVAVDIVAKVEHVQLGRLCRKRVIFVVRMSNVLSTFGRLCRIRQNRPCRIRLCHHDAFGTGKPERRAYPIVNKV